MAAISDSVASDFESSHQPERQRWWARDSLIVAALTGVLVPLVIVTAWIPVRSRLPNTDLALVLVGAIGAIGALRHREAVVLAAVSGALWFEFFDTVPYERWAIARNPDVETTVVLAVVSLLGGELVLRAGRYRRASRDDEENLTNVRQAAELVASGEELVHVIASVAGQLARLLALDSCEFEAMPADPALPQVSRLGIIEDVAPLGPCPHVRADMAEMPVIVQGEPLGYFVLKFGTTGVPSCERLRVGVTLGDHVGAAFLAQAPPPPPKAPEPRLRVVKRRFGEPAGAELSGSAQETAGFSSQLGRMIS
ncbi:MAG: DUF4118 domain-containing protein [Acidimicrobiales bacterium]